MVRSIPEKTFEHWLSMYVAHRFPTGGLWWPTMGEDINVEDLGTVPGKACLLEAKVPEQTGATSHVVEIDLVQLAKYAGSVVPVYYVIPEPAWSGKLHSSTWIGSERRADLAYRRSQHRWFGGWTYVCRASDLLAHIAPSPAQKMAKLSTPPTIRWGWRDFWHAFADCGSPDLPALFLTPGNLGPSLQRGDARSSLAATREQLRFRPDSQRELARRQLRDVDLTYYVPTAGADTYRRISSNELAQDAILSRGQDVGTADANDSNTLSVAALPFDSLNV